METATTTHALVVSCKVEGNDEIDEAQLLAETEELLMSLDPIAFVDACETQSKSSASASTLCSSDNSDSSSTNGSQSISQIDTAPVIVSRKRVPKPGAVRNPSRERLQNELMSLRKQVIELENDLQNTQERQAASSAENKVAVVPMWERIAKRQLVACERAVADNKRLKSMIKVQKEMVVNMEEALYNWQHVAIPNESAILGSLNHPVPHKNVHLEPGDDLLFAMLVSELDATYLKVDEAFQVAGLHQKNIESYIRNTPKTLVASDGTRRSVFELVEVEFSPFDYEMVSRAIKICSEKLSQSPDCLVYEGGDWDPKVVFTEKIRVKRLYNGDEIFVDMLLAIKEYEFEDQVVCVWRCMFKCDDHFPDAYVQEMGWHIVANVESQANNSSSSSKTSPVGSLSRMCVHLEPKRFAAPSASIKAEADTMTNLVMNNYHDDMQEMNAMMENLLVEESLQQNPSKPAVLG